MSDELKGIGISDMEIAGIMGWRGPGAYTEATLRKIKRVLEEDRGRRTAPSAPMGEELPALTEPFDHVDMADGSIAAVFSADQYCQAQRAAREYQRKVDEKIIARRDECIRQLERELAERKQSVDTPEFQKLLHAMGATTGIPYHYNRLIAHIDGRTAGAAPEGWKLVPIEPTADMVEAAFAGVMEDQDLSRQIKRREAMAKNYAAMLAAAPTPMNSGKEEGNG